MYQVTAVYQGCEVGYAEGEDFADACDNCLTELSYGLYAEVIEDMTLIVIKPNGRRYSVSVASLLF